MTAATKPPTAMQAVFNDPNGPGKIILGDFLGNDRRLWKVNRLFRDASRHALVHAGSAILGGRIAAQKPPTPDEVEAAEARLPQLFADVTRKIGEVPSRDATLRLGALWDGTVQAHTHWTQEPEGERRSHGIFTLVQHLETANRNLDVFAADRRIAVPVAEPYGRILESLKQIVMQDRLARRFAEVVRAGQLNPRNPATVSASFAALYENQNAGIRAVNPRLPLLAKPEYYSADSFRWAENEVFGYEYLERDQGLAILWREIRGGINGAPDTHFASRIRAFMNDEANFPALAQREHCVVQAQGQVPPEIGRLTGLRDLQWQGAAAFLPAEFRNLEQLETLRFEHAAFDEIPPVLERLPALYWLIFERNQRPITRLPDGVERHIHSGLRHLLMIYWQEMSSAMRPMDWLGTPFIQRSFRENTPYFGLNYHQFTEIPFRVWFRENISIPNIPFSLLLLLVPVVHYTGETIATFIDSLLRDDVIAAFVAVIACFLLFVAPALALLLLSLPTFLINCALNVAVEPAITTARDYFGYSRMVQVDRRAEMPEAGDPNQDEVNP